MKIYLYFKIDRGFYESAHAQWRAHGGRFEDHLLRTQHTIYSWVREFQHQGHEIMVDWRSSFLLPQDRRKALPMTIASVLRGGLWVTKLDPWLLQRNLISRVSRFNPDVVFVPLGSAIWASTLTALRGRGLPLVQWCGLPVETMLERDRRNLPFFDLFFTPANLADGLRRAGARGRIEYVPIGIDPAVHRPVSLTASEHARFDSDVCFIGGLSSRFHQARREMVEYAIGSGVNMKVWGGYREHFAGSPILSCWQGQIWGEEQVKALCATKVGLNFHVDHKPGELDRGLNVRAFELAACGVFQLLQRVPSVGEFFVEGQEIVCFDTPEEMLAKIRYYLAHADERRQIAAAALARARRDHTWASRVQRMSALMSEQKPCETPA